MVTGSSMKVILSLGISYRAIALRIGLVLAVAIMMALLGMVESHQQRSL